MLFIEKVTIWAEYSDFVNIFLKKLVKILPKYIIGNEYAIKLKINKQPPYKLIYSLRPIELEAFKIYIEINSTNSFIRPLKLLANTLLFFVQKSDKSFYLYINY